MEKNREKNAGLAKKITQKCKNEVLGASQVDKFALGELVKWPRWRVESDCVQRDFHYGVILEIYTGILDKRPIKIAKILPLGKDIPVKISLLMVKKSDLKD